MSDMKEIKIDYGLIDHSIIKKIGRIGVLVEK